MGEFSLQDMTENEAMHYDLYNDNFGVYNNSYLIVRRNVDGLAFKKTMKDDDNNKLIEFLKEFGKAVPVSIINGAVHLAN